MNNLDKLTKKLRKFNEERDWDQFHNYKDLAISLVLEATEVLEHFQWKNPKEMESRVKTHREELMDELGDVLIYLVQISDKLGINLLDAAEKKLEKSAKKYPVKKSKGRHTKYTEL
ncbi:nucleotide pyrophosphohydrolase [Patescibacteria group bacterium]|nr:nucleotide pyrophosphohydrolase [Patescibacteria group bacterium]